MEDLGAKAAANIWGHNTQFVLWDAQYKCAHQKTDHVGVLAGGIERVFIIGAGIVAHGHAWLHRVCDEAVVHKLQRGDMRRVGEGCIGGFAVGAELPVVAEVIVKIVMHLGRAGRESRAHIDDGGQFFDIEHDGFGSRARLFKAVSDNGSNRITHMADLALRQNRVGRFFHRVAVLVRDLPTAGQTAHAFEISAREDADNA